MSSTLRKTLWPVFLSYILSFVYIGIYWNNHHHMLHVAKRVNASIMWANSHLLFWLSLIPFATGWMGENDFAPAPTAIYGMMLLMSAIAYWLLQRTIIGAHGKESLLTRAIGTDLKGKISPVLYLIAIVSTFFQQWVALMWLLPDRRIETTMAAETGDRN